MSRGKSLLLTLKSVRIHILITILCALIAKRWDVNGLVAVLLGGLSTTLLTAHEKYNQFANLPEPEPPTRDIRVDVPTRMPRRDVRMDAPPRMRRSHRVGRLILIFGGILIAVALILVIAVWAYLYIKFR